MTTPDIPDLCRRLRRAGLKSSIEAAPILERQAAILERQAAEIERLRTGLEKVAAYYGTGHRVTEIARAALTGEDTAGSPSSQNTEPGLAFSDAGET
jgi:hypothetical protein